MSTRNLKAIRRERKKAPQLVEGPKQLLVLKGPTSSAILNELMTDLRMIKAPEAKALTRKNDIRPFEDVSSLEFLCEKNECPAFLYASHSKKRPHNLVLGRMFDKHLLDMVELGVVGYEPISEIEGPKKMIGSSPLMVFNGDEWERSPELTRLRNMLLDVFGARDMTGVALAGVDHVISLTVVDGTVYWRTYFVHLKKSNGKVPRVELAPMGPSLDLKLRRHQAPSSDLEKAALRQPKALAPTKEKNVSTNEFGETVGRIHMERQDFSKLTMKKGRAQRADKKRKADDGEDEGAEVEADEVDMGSKTVFGVEALDDDDEAPAKQKKAKKARLTAGPSTEFSA